MRRAYHAEQELVALKSVFDEVERHLAESSSRPVVQDEEPGAGEEDVKSMDEIFSDSASDDGKEETGGGAESSGRRGVDNLRINRVSSSSSDIRRGHSISKFYQSQFDSLREVDDMERQMERIRSGAWAR